MVLRRTPTPDSKVVTAYVTPTGEGDQPIQAIQMDLTSYINGRRINRLLDNEKPDPQDCAYQASGSVSLKARR